MEKSFTAQKKAEPFDSAVRKDVFEAETDIRYCFFGVLSAKMNAE